MSTRSIPSLVVVVVRERGLLRVVARQDNARDSLVEATFAPEGMAFRVTRGGQSQSFSREKIHRHPALSAILRLIGDEVDMGKSCSQELLGFLLQSALVYVSRMATPNPLPKWGRPVRDRRIERAVELLNSDISKRWTVELLARAVGLSRPAFARQFMRVLGASPMRYLTQRRMQIAATLLLSTDAGLAEVASSVGYHSEYAFSRAFKRHHRVPPGVYRRTPPTLMLAARRKAA